MVQRQIDNTFFFNDFHLVSGIEGRQYLSQVLPIGKMRHKSGFCQLFICDDYFPAKDSFQIIWYVAERDVEKMNRPAVFKRSEIAIPEIRFFSLAGLTVILDCIAGLQLYFSGSLPAFLTAFTRRKKLSQEEIEQLQQLIEENRGWAAMTAFLS